MLVVVYGHYQEKVSQNNIYPFFLEKLFFEKTVSRNRFFCYQITVVGNKGNYQLSRKDLENLGQTYYFEIIEACPRNTAAAIAFAAFDSNPDDIFLLLRQIT